MNSIPTFTKSGQKATVMAKLEKDIFDSKVINHELLKRAYLAYLSNGRVNLAKTKKRGEVRGGGIKPWRQKGTGRARVGSIRSPLWRSGGITFGPTGDENYKKVIDKATKKRALKQALTLATQSEKIKVIEAFEFKEGKVSQTVRLLKKIGAKPHTLLVVDSKDQLAERSTNNLQDVSIVYAKYLNVFEILNADTIIISKEAISIIHEWLGVKKEVSK